MWVDMDDVRAELERSRREIEEEFDEESDWFVMTFLAGVLSGYGRVKMMLDELEKAYRERESECVRGMKEVGSEESR